MATPQTPESGKEEQEPRVPPVPEISETSSDQQPSGGRVESADALADEVRQLRKQVESIPDLVERQVQSVKDRRLSPVDTAFQDVPAETLRAFNAYLKKFDGDEERAIRELQVDQMLAERGVQSGQPVPGRTGDRVGEPKGLSDWTADRLSQAQREYGVDVSDEALTELRDSRTWRSEADWRDAVNDLIIKTVRQGSVTPAAAVGSQGKPPVPRSEEGELRQQYDREIQQIKAGKHPTIKRGQAGAIVALQREYRKKGLDI